MCCLHDARAVWFVIMMIHGTPCTPHTAKLMLGASDGAELRPGCIIVAMPISFIATSRMCFNEAPSSQQQASKEYEGLQ